MEVKVYIPATNIQSNWIGTPGTPGCPLDSVQGKKNKTKEYDPPVGLSNSHRVMFAGRFQG